MPTEVKEEWEEDRLLALALLKMEEGIEGDLIAGPIPAGDEEVATRIAEQIEKKFDYAFIWSGGIAGPFLDPQYAFKTWRAVWSFYTLRLKTLKEKCNRKFECPRSTNALNLYLINLFYAAKLKCRDHLTGIKLVKQNRHPGNVSFGKVIHDKVMTLGFEKFQPQSLDDFNEETCNVIPEAWCTNYFRGDKGSEDLDVFLNWLAEEGGRVMFPDVPHGTWKGSQVRNMVKGERDGDRNGKNRQKVAEVEVGRAEKPVIKSSQTLMTNFFQKGKGKAPFEEPIDALVENEPVDLTGLDSEEEDRPTIWVLSDSDDDQPGPSNKRQRKA